LKIKIIQPDVEVTTKMFNIGNVEVKIKNKCEADLHNIDYNITIEKDRPLKIFDINIPNNETINLLEKGNTTAIHSAKISLKLGIANLHIKLTHLGFSKNIDKKVLLIGRIAIVLPQLKIKS